MRSPRLIYVAALGATGLLATALSLKPHLVGPLATAVAGTTFVLELRRRDHDRRRRGPHE
jgi:hypothetical protein